MKHETVLPRETTGMEFEVPEEAFRVLLLSSWDIPFISSELQSNTEFC